MIRHIGDRIGRIKGRAENIYTAVPYRAASGAATATEPTRRSDAEK